MLTLALRTRARETVLILHLVRELGEFEVSEREYCARGGGESKESLVYGEAGVF